jgi:hypothetical protein
MDQKASHIKDDGVIALIGFVCLYSANRDIQWLNYKLRKQKTTDSMTRIIL